MDMRGTGVRALALATLTTVAIGVGTGSAHACGERPRVGPGQVGAATLGLQLLLQRYGYPVPGTGFYGPRTRDAMRDFQRRNDIKPNGVVGSKTWRALVGPFPVHDAEPLPQLRPGSTDAATVRRLHDVLWRAEAYRRPVDTDQYGGELRERVTAFQRRVGIEASGVVGARTWDALLDAGAVAGDRAC